MKFMWDGKRLLDRNGVMHRRNDNKEGMFCTKLHKLLKEFVALFSKPKGLPPNRSRDHAI